MPAKRIELAGQRFARLRVIAANGRRGSDVRWLCQCDCGNETTVDGSKLRAGLTRSCGCFVRDRNRLLNTIHGHADRSPTWKTWRSMRQRCADPSNRSFAHYGAKGITVCERWADFRCFLADMGERPPGMSIDRLDNGRGYEPNNCRWATASQQQRNRSSNRLLTIDGVTKCVQEWADQSGLSYATIWQRVVRGWAADLWLIPNCHRRPITGAPEYSQ